MLRGEDQPLMHGWYCVKQRDMAQLQDGITWEEAKSYEMEFFQTVAPWADLNRVEQQRLGSQKLADRLGTILSNLVSKEYVSLSSGPPLPLIPLTFTPSTGTRSLGYLVSERKSTLN